MSRGIKQEVLAGAVGVSRNTLNRLENGWNQDPPLRLLVSIARALGVDDWRELAEDAWLQPKPGVERLDTAEDWEARAETHNRRLAEQREESRLWRLSSRSDRI